MSLRNRGCVEVVDCLSLPSCPIQEVYGYPPLCPRAHPTRSLSTNSCLCSLFPACGSGLAQGLHTPWWSAVPGFGFSLPHEPHFAAKVIFPRPILVNIFHSLSLHFLQAGVPTGRNCKFLMFWHHLSFLSCLQPCPGRMCHVFPPSLPLQRLFLFLRTFLIPQLPYSYTSFHTKLNYPLCEALPNSQP